MSKHIIFTDYDLDGTVSYMCYLWLYSNKDIEHRVKRVGVNDLREVVTLFLRNNKFQDYDRVFFFDLDCSEVVDLIDHKNVIIIDHHDTHIVNKSIYKNCVTILKPYPSCAGLIYSIFSKQDSNIITKKRSALIKCVNDYDSYTLKYSQSIKLNYVLRYTNNGFDNFIQSFYNGFGGFTQDQKRIYLFHLDKVEQIKQKLQLYEGKFGEFNVVFCFNDHYINEICNYCLEKTNHDFCIMVSLTKKRVYYRKNKSCKLNMGKLASKLSNGGGHPEAAGGELSDKLLNVVKTFTEIK